MSQKHRVAHIGCGKRGRAFVEALAQDPGVELVAFVDVAAENAEAFRDEFAPNAIVKVDLDEMLAEVKPDVVTTALWTALHLPAFKACAEAGVKAVLSEKPMAPTWADCLQMKAVADKTGCQLSFCHQRRHAPGNLAVRKAIAEGAIGQVERMDLYSPPNLLDCGTHTLDQAMSFNAESPVKWVLGAVDTTDTVDYFGLVAEQMCCAQIVFENGVRANMQVGGDDKDIWGGVRVHGSEGFIAVFWDGDVHSAARYDDPKWTFETEKVEGIEHMKGLVRNVLESLEKGVPSETSLEKALAVTGPLFGVYESVRTHRKIDMPLEGVQDNPFMSMLAEGAFRKR